MAINVFLKFTGPVIAGDATDAGHAGEILVLSWSHSFNQPGRPASADAKEASHADFTFSKYLDGATDDLLRHCWNGEAIAQATLSAYRSDGDGPPSLYLQVVMDDVVLSNVSIGGGAGDLPTENVSLAYAKVAYVTGGKTASHDLINQVVG